MNEQIENIKIKIFEGLSTNDKEKTIKELSNLCKDEKLLLKVNGFNLNVFVEYITAWVLTGKEYYKNMALRYLFKI